MNKYFCYWSITTDTLNNEHNASVELGDHPSEASSVFNYFSKSISGTANDAYETLESTIGR